MVRINLDLDMTTEQLDLMGKLYLESYPHVDFSTVSDKLVVEHVIHQFGEYGIGNQNDCTLDSCLDKIIKRQLRDLYNKFNPDDEDEYEDPLQGIRCLIAVYETALKQPKYNISKVEVQSDGRTIWVNGLQGCIIRIGNIEDVINRCNHMQTYEGITSEFEHMIDVIIR